jgi:hypothetical protein
MREATKFVQAEIAKSSSTPACGASCVIAIVLDSLAIGWESRRFGDDVCTLPVLVMWWATGILTLTVDQKLDFPEAVHMLMQQVTSVGYGSSGPPGDSVGLKIFHGLHGVLSQMTVARVTGEALEWVLKSKIGNQPQQLGITLVAMIAASTLVYAADLHLGSTTNYPSYFDALIDGFYQVLVTMTTIGYGDLGASTNWGKLLTPVGMPLLTNAFSNFVGSTAQSEGDRAQEETDLKEKGLTGIEVCKCFGKAICR